MDLNGNFSRPNSIASCPKFTRNIVQKLAKLGCGQRLLLLSLGVATALFIILTQVQPGVAQNLTQIPPARLPALMAHPLPEILEQWQDDTHSGDYFSQVQPTVLGYLVWSQLPIRVYLDAHIDNNEQQQRWVGAVEQAIQEWSTFLPLVVIQEPEEADITFSLTNFPLRLSPVGEILRARAAETSYEFYISSKGTPEILSHRCIIKLSPSLIPPYLLAAARHELGHALGIWGHSPVETDVMYFSQVRQPPLISARDVSTLKRVYEQPTRLGWKVNSIP